MVTIAPFQGCSNGECFQGYFRQHWIRIVPTFLKTLLASIILIATALTFFVYIGVEDDGIRHSFLLVFLFAFAGIQLQFLFRFYLHFLYVIILTDQKIHRIKKTLFSIDDQQVLNLAIIQDVNKIQHGFLQNLFGYGSLILEAQETQLTLHFVPSVGQIAKEIIELRDKAHRKENEEK